MQKRKERKYVQTFILVASELKDHGWLFFSNFFQLYRFSQQASYSQERKRKTAAHRADADRGTLAALRLTLQYSSIGIRRLTATSRMWLRRKRILPAEKESTQHWQGAATSSQHGRCDVHASGRPEWYPNPWLSSLPPDGYPRGLMTPGVVPQSPAHSSSAKAGGVGPGGTFR